MSASGSRSGGARRTERAAKLGAREAFGAMAEGSWLEVRRPSLGVDVVRTRSGNRLVTTSWVAHLRAWRVTVRSSIAGFAELPWERRHCARRGDALAEHRRAVGRALERA